MNAILLLALFFGLTGCGSGRPASDPDVQSSDSPELRTAPPASTTSLKSVASPAGVADVRAIELARPHTSFTTVLSATAGVFRDLYGAGRLRRSETGSTRVGRQVRR
jgi:hypothetical protein